MRQIKVLFILCWLSNPLFGQTTNYFLVLNLNDNSKPSQVKSILQRFDKDIQNANDIGLISVFIRQKESNFIASYYSKEEYKRDQEILPVIKGKDKIKFPISNKNFDSITLKTMHNASIYGERSNQLYFYMKVSSDSQIRGNREPLFSELEAFLWANNWIYDSETYQSQIKLKPVINVCVFIDCQNQIIKEEFKNKYSSRHVLRYPFTIEFL